MYQIINPDGSKYDPVGVDVLQRWAQESRIQPDTPLLDSVHGQTIRAGDLTDLQGYFTPVPYVNQAPSGPMTPVGAGDPMVSVATGLAIAAICVAVIGWIPCLGWLQYFAIGLGIGALVLSLVRNSQGSSGTYTTPLVMASIALVIGIPRFILGGWCGV